MASPTIPIPLQDPIARPRDYARFPVGKSRDPLEGLITDSWIKYLTNQAQTIAGSPLKLSTVSLTAQTGSIAATPFGTGTTNSGLYIVWYQFHITTAAAVSSSLSVTLSWTQNGSALSKAFTAVTTNTTATTDSQSYMILSDAAAPITYATTYASVGAPAMAYEIYLLVWQASI